MLLQSAESRYNAWVRDHYRFLLRSAWALTGSRAIAEDVVQDLSLIHISEPTRPY